MQDDSHLDLQYFINAEVYNCPFCNRRHVTYEIIDWSRFNWSEEKMCTVYFVRCNSCRKISMHLSYYLLLPQDARGQYVKRFSCNKDIDSKLFYSVPSSFFVVDNRIPAAIRELITEAEGSVKMNFLTGGSACTRKAIYELLVKEKAAGDDYQTKIKSLKNRYSSVDGELFDILGHI
jgi:hypothetical protein